MKTHCNTYLSFGVPENMVVKRILKTTILEFNSSIEKYLKSQSVYLQSGHIRTRRNFASPPTKSFFVAKLLYETV